MDTPESTNLILHLGLGAFHRAHQAWYLNRLAQAGDSSWRLAGGNLRPDAEELVSALAAQHCEYTLETVAPDGTREYERIRSIATVIPWETGLERIVALGASPQTRIVSFTVTEAGYHFSNRGGLDPTSADLASDLADGTLKTIYGAIVAILRRRMDSGGGPVTLLNCDNLRGNGERFRHLLLEFLAWRQDHTLRDWVQANTSCPNSMVDRITPRPVPAIRERVLAATGWNDAAPIMSEHYAQWVIEDHFIAGRPRWESIGAQLVDSVAPYEEAKIRILNGSHSCIAWAGTLRGRQLIHESVADPVVRGITHAYISEDVIPCLQPSPLDLAAYRDTVLERFGNPHIEDSNARVAADSFAKLPGFIVPTIRQRLAQNQPIEAAARVAALFFIFLERLQRGLIPYAYTDQTMDAALLGALFTGPQPLQRYCEIPALWGDLTGRPALTAAIGRAHDDLKPLLGL